MKFLKIALVVLVFLVNLVIASPSLADAPKLTETPEYTEVTQGLNDLWAKTPEELGYTTEEFTKKVSNLQLQKYILETASGWSQCRNETGKTLAVYAHKPKKSASQETTLYFLGDGEMTDDDWNCDGIYIPSGTKIAVSNFGDRQRQEIAEPLAFKFVSGTQVVATTNSETGEVEVNVPPAKVLKAGEDNVYIPNFSLADIQLIVPNAPIED